MTSKDDISVDDKDFDAFLQHEGELTQLLKALPQSMPSADLDAAILAAAKAELEKNPAPQSVVQIPATTAANDPGSPAAARVTPGFVRRWRVPLGLAASLLVTVQLVRWQLTEEQTVPGAPAVLYESAPVAAPASAAPAMLQDKVLDDVSAPAAQSAAQEKLIAPPPPPEAQLESRRSKMPNRVADAAGNVAAEIASPPLMFKEPAVESYARAPAPGPSLVNPAPMAAPKPSFAPDVSPRAIAPVPPPAPAAIVEAPPVAPPPARFAPAPASPVQRVEITGSTIRRADAETASPVQVIVAEDLKKSGATSVAGVIVDPADAWLSKIDALLKAGSNQEALQEWRKFRKEYPDYAVPDGISEKIKPLDK
jgi:hypothetical protein